MTNLSSVFEQDKMEQNIIAELLDGERLHAGALWHSCATTSITVENFENLILRQMFIRQLIECQQLDEGSILYYLKETT